MDSIHGCRVIVEAIFCRVNGILDTKDGHHVVDGIESWSEFDDEDINDIRYFEDGGYFIITVQ